MFHFYAQLTIHPVLIISVMYKAPNPTDGGFVDDSYYTFYLTQPMFIHPDQENVNKITVRNSFLFLNEFDFHPYFYKFHCYFV